jgi:hypothetical protein
MNFKIFTLLVSAFRNNVAKLHLNSFHRSRQINNNVLKLWLLLDLQVRQRWKQLQSSVAETIAEFIFFSPLFYGTSIFLYVHLVTILHFQR